MPDVICTTVDGPLPAKRKQSCSPLPPKRAFSSSLIQISSCSPLRSDSLLPSSRQVYNHHTQVHEDNKTNGIRTHNTTTTTSTTTATTNESTAPSTNYDRSFSLDETSLAPKNGANPVTWIVQPTDICWYNPELKPPLTVEQISEKSTSNATYGTNSGINNLMADSTAIKCTNKLISFKSPWSDEADSDQTFSVCRKLVQSIHQGSTLDKNPPKSAQPQSHANAINSNNYGVPSTNDSAILIQQQEKIKSKKKGLVAFFEWLVGGPLHATNPDDRVYGPSNRQNPELANFETDDDSIRHRHPGIYTKHNFNIFDSVKICANYESIRYKIKTIT